MKNENANKLELVEEEKKEEEEESEDANHEKLSIQFWNLN